MSRVLVTGATGFVGRQLCELLSQRGCTVRAALRTDQIIPEHAPECVVVGDIGSLTNWGSGLDGVDCVVHCAARAHVLGDQNGDLNLYMETNAAGTARLAQACVDARVRRFVYLSSVKVNGEKSLGRPLASSDTPGPEGPYAVSKWLGEQRSMEIAARSSMEISVVRSPLVYGPNVRANFLRLMRWVDMRMPLPFGCIRNSRSLVSVWNLCDLIARLVRGPVPNGSVFMVSDGEDMSTPELVRRIGAAMGRPARLLPVPIAVLRAIGVLGGRREEIERLCGSLTVDISSTRTVLDWSPPLAVDEGIARTVGWYLAEVQSS